MKCFDTFKIFTLNVLQLRTTKSYELTIYILVDTLVSIKYNKTQSIAAFFV